MRTTLAVTTLAVSCALQLGVRRPTLLPTQQRAACQMGLASPGDYCAVSWSVKLADSGEPLPADAVMFDEGDCALVVDGGAYMPALHSCVQKLEAMGEPSSFEISPSEAFGEANPKMGPVTVPAASAPEGLGAGDVVRLANGLKARVVEIEADGGVTIDANHELAGKAISLTVSLREPPKPSADVLETCTFAGGCFWGVELAFQREPGVVATAVGYTQGGTVSPTYKEVCSGATGHTEAIEVRFDPSEVSYSRLLELFWDRLGENAFKLNQVGNDRGTQYRHGIYTHSDEQAAAAKTSFDERQAAAGAMRIETELLPATQFWVGEEYHQQYLQKGGQSAKKTAKETIRCYG